MAKISYEEFAAHMREAGVEMSDEELRKIYRNYRLIGWASLIGLVTIVGCSIYGIYKLFSRS